MEVLSSNDILFLKAALSGGAVAVTHSLLTRWLNPRPSPISFPLLQGTAKNSNDTLVPTRSIKKQLEQTGKSGIIFYGTQTGTAERLASRLSREASARYNLDLLVADLDDYDYVDLQALDPFQPVFFVIATYGEGEPTDNAAAFNHYLAQLTEKHGGLPKLTYATFGLGSSAYKSFNAMILKVDAAMRSTGARRLGIVGLGDDCKGRLDEHFTAWSQMTLAQFAQEYGLQEREYRYAPSFNILEPLDEKLVYLGEPNKIQLHRRIRGPHTAQNPLPAKIIRAQELYQSDRQCIHLEFDIAGSTLQYETGDHLAVWPMNSDTEVQRFMRAFDIADPDKVISVSGNDPTDKVPIPSPTTYSAAARHYLDIRAPVSCRMVQQLAGFASRPQDAARLSDLASDSEAFERVVTACRMSIAQLIDMVTAGHSLGSVPFSFLLENIPKLKPRHYSISSSCLESKNTISITAVVDSLTSTTPDNNLIDFKGVCTSYLLSLKHLVAGEDVLSTHQVRLPQVSTPGAHALIHVRSSNFRLPRNPKTPVIMIGPGTGVAPFRAFVKERIVQSRTRDTGKMLLFFGCRDEDEFLYRHEWEEALLVLPDGKFEMCTTFSRKAGHQKQYVQHILKEQSQQLSQKVLHDNAHVYVCGDAKRMAKDVWHCFEDMVGTEYLKEMKRAGRWKEDVW